MPPSYGAGAGRALLGCSGWASSPAPGRHRSPGLRLPLLVPFLMVQLMGCRAPRPGAAPGPDLHLLDIGIVAANTRWSDPTDSVWHVRLPWPFNGLLARGGDKLSC